MSTSESSDSNDDIVGIETADIKYVFLNLYYYLLIKYIELTMI